MRAVRARLAALDEGELASVLTARELEALRMGARERITDTDQAHIAALAAARFPGCSPRPPRVHARRASTASNCTMRTPIRWPRFCRR